VTTRTLYLFLALGLSVALFDSGRVYGATQAGGSFPSRPVRVNRALAYCAAHPTATSYHATIRGFSCFAFRWGLHVRAELEASMSRSTPSDPFGPRIERPSYR
jgi:hypothetical protein